MSRYTSPPVQAAEPPAQDADKAGWLRDLALSYQEAGDALLGRGHFAKASEKYQASLKLFDRLAMNESDNPRAQVDLANALARIADARAVEAKAHVVQVTRVAKEIGFRESSEPCAPRPRDPMNGL